MKVNGVELVRDDGGAGIPVLLILAASPKTSSCPLPMNSLPPGGSGSFHTSDGDTGVRRPAPSA
jgi:hypothetical protein